MYLIPSSYLWCEQSNMEIYIPEGRKAYFISDAHLGAPNHASSLDRERKLVNWIHSIENDCDVLFILGDLFDFWFEYSKVVPKGFVRILGRLAQLSDRGVPVYYFTGNHDMWMKGYFEEEIGITVLHDPLDIVINGKSFLIGHGDGLGPGDHAYKLTKKIFKSKVAQWFFARLHPNFGVSFAKWLSSSSRKHNGHHDANFLGEDREFLVQFAKKHIQSNKVDFFVFGHRHFPIELDLNNHSRFVNLGDWLQHYTYAEFDGESLILKKYH